jgi:predicted Zn finger-like uncharacterized protein
MSAVRLRRLQADYEKLKDFVGRHPRLNLIEAFGDPPERYQLEYKIRSIRQVDEDLKIVKEHLVEIALPRDYPRMPPQCRMLSPVFHPNIAPHAICVGDHWSAGEPLWSIVARIGEMIAYQSYNTKSPLNGEAARWVDENRDRLPLDPVSMLVEEPAEAVFERPTSPPARRPRPAAPEPRSAPVGEAPPVAVAAIVEEPDHAIGLECPSCGARYRIPAESSARRARCKHCQTLIVIPRS